MAEWVEFTAKTVDEALTEALIKLETTSDNIEYEIITGESNGFLGLFSKQAKIRVRKKEDIQEVAKNFLNKVFNYMDVSPEIEMEYNEEEGSINVNLVGEGMGMLIGKRGQTLDSLQYLTSLVANKDKDKYIKIKIDTENYRQRRKETIENLAKNIAHKVKKTHRPAFLEPMNPYERRIIHSALQDDKFVETHSEGEEPNRKVVVTLKKEYMDSPRRSNGGYQKRNNYRSNNGNRNRKQY